MDKTIHLYLRIAGRYKIIVYSLIATLILLQYQLIAYTFYALSFYELSLVLIDFYKESRKLKYENKSNEIQILKLRLEEKKAETKKETYSKRK